MAFLGFRAKKREALLLTKCLPQVFFDKMSVLQEDPVFAETWMAAQVRIRGTLSGSCRSISGSHFFF